MENKNEYCVLDIETTGFSPEKDKITEIGVYKVSGNKVVDKFDQLVNPEMKMPFHIKVLTKITDDMVINADKINDVMPKLIDFVGDAPVVAHNARFDIRFLKHNAEKLGYKFDNKYIDTLALSKKAFPDSDSYKLGELANKLNIKVENEHRALDDVDTLNQLFDIILKKMDIKDVKELTKD